MVWSLLVSVMYLIDTIVLWWLLKEDSDYWSSLGSAAGLSHARMPAAEGQNLLLESFISDEPVKINSREQVERTINGHTQALLPTFPFTQLRLLKQIRSPFTLSSDEVVMEEMQGSVFVGVQHFISGFFAMVRGTGRATAERASRRRLQAPRRCACPCMESGRMWVGWSANPYFNPIPQPEEPARSIVRGGSWRSWRLVLAPIPGGWAHRQPRYLEGRLPPHAHSRSSPPDLGATATRPGSGCGIAWSSSTPAAAWT